MPDPRPPYWLCSPRTPTCRKRHPYISYRENARGSVLEYRGGSPWLLLTCGTCGGHAFGMVSAEHDILHMYEIDERQLEVLMMKARTVKGWVILEFLGYMETRDADAERALAEAIELQQGKAGK